MTSVHILWLLAIVILACVGLVFYWLGWWAGVKAALWSHESIRACTRQPGHDGPCNGWLRPDCHWKETPRDV